MCKKIIWPVFHVLERIKYEASENRAHRRKELLEFENVWVMVKTIEYGLENSIQLFLILYLLVPYNNIIYQWEFQQILQKSFRGIAHFLTFGNVKACLLEKTVGKLFMNLVGQSLTVSLLMFQKHGISFCDNLIRFLPLWLSIFAQICARMFAFRIFFLTNQVTEILIFFCFHFMFVLLVKMLFELRRDHFTSCPMTFMNILRFIISWLSCAVIYMRLNPPRQKNIHHNNSFIPQTIFQVN